MHPEEYQNIFRQEDTHWWYVSMRNLVSSILSKILKSNDSLVILDVGCGTGGTLFNLKKEFPSLILNGVDLSYQALTYCQKRGLSSLLQASVEDLPFADDSIDLVLSIDTLYHLGVKSDEKALEEIYRILKKEGYLILHLPAFEFLKGGHDRIVYTRQRYTRNRLCHKIKGTGFKIISCTYRHMILFPVIFLKRRIERFHKNFKIESDIKALSPWLNRLLSSISLCENRIINYVNLPIGSSLLCLARKT